MLQPDAVILGGSDDESPPIAWRAVVLEAEIIEVFDRRPEPGEQLEIAFRRKEAELVAVFDQLTVIDARELRRRLSRAVPNDPVAVRFARLIPQRRVRLLAFLDDARRRDALRSGGR